VPPQTHLKKPLLSLDKFSSARRFWLGAHLSVAKCPFTYPWSLHSTQHKDYLSTSFLCILTTTVFVMQHHMLIEQQETNRLGPHPLILTHIFTLHTKVQWFWQLKGINLLWAQNENGCKKTQHFMLWVKYDDKIGKIFVWQTHMKNSQPKWSFLSVYFNKSLLNGVSLFWLTFCIFQKFCTMLKLLHV